jgi:hypothetical protein
MSSSGHHRTLAALLTAPGNETQQMLFALQGRAWAVRIVPSPPVISPLVYAHTWYEWTGQRQWLAAPTLELPD